MIFDSSGVNVARGKPCYGNLGGPTLGCYNANSCCPKLYDMIANMDDVNATDFTSMYHSSATGAWTEVDLGGLYDIRRAYIFNRFYGPQVGGAANTGGATGSRMAGAVISMRNWNNVTLYTGTATGAPYTVYTVTLPSASATASQTQTGTPSPSTTPSSSETSTSTISFDALPSDTATTTATPAATPTPLSALPKSLRLRSPGGKYLSLTEVLIVTPTGQILLLAQPSVALMSGSAAAGGPAVDGCLDPWAGCPLASSPSASAATFTLTWPQPTEIALVSGRA
jgi:hypothetical protein